MKLRIYALLSVLFFTMILGGCGKKETVADDLNEIQEVSTDSEAVTKTSDVKTADIKGTPVKLYFEEPEVASGYKVYDSNKITMDDTLLARYGSVFFDDGVFYKSSEDMPGEDGQLLEQIVFNDDGSTMNVAFLKGNIDSKPWYLSIYQYEEDFALGGYRMELETSDSMQRSDYYEADLEDCKIDLDLEDTILDAEALLRKWGYEDYEYVAAKGLVDSPYGNSFEGHGYHLIFEKEIDGITCDVYENYYLKMAVDEEDVVPTVIERIDLSYDESGMFRVIVEERYEIDEISGKVTSLLGVSEAEEIALKEIEVNFAKDGELEYLGDIYGMDSNFFQNGEDVNTVYIDLKYVPLMYGEDVIYAPVYLFTMCDDVDGYENHSYIIAAVSALDGVAFTPCFR